MHLNGTVQPLSEKFEIKWHDQGFGLLQQNLLGKKDYNRPPIDLNEFLVHCLRLEKDQANYWNTKLLEILGTEKTLVFTESILTPELINISLDIAILPLDDSSIIFIVNDMNKELQCQGLVLSAIIDTEERERFRIARDLHDSVGQYLSMAYLNLRNLSSIESLPKKGKEKITETMNYINYSIEEIRNIAHGMAPQVIKNEGLENTMRRYAQVCNSNLVDTKVRFHSNLEGQRFQWKLEIALFRIFQEALNNAIKHSKAKHIDVQILAHPTCVIMSIEDDGIGFDKTAQKTKNGFGIGTMVTRVESLYGWIDICSHPGHGTSVMANIPLSISNKKVEN